MLRNTLRQILRGTIGAAALLAVATGAHAADKLRVAKAGTALLFETIDVGQAAGIFQKLNVDVEAIQMDGEAPGDKAIASGDVDIMLGGGNSMGFRLKGVPDIGVASMSGPPYDFALAVNYDSPIQSAAELKGKNIGVTSIGSTTDYLVHELSRAQGWGPDGMTSVSLGSTKTRIAALAKGDIQAMVTTPELGFDSQDHKETRVLLLFGDVVKDFMAHSILARQELVDKNPDLVRRFLQGWFQTVAYMRTPEGRKMAIPIIAKGLSISESAIEKAYDPEVAHMSGDGVFKDNEVEATRQAFVPFHLLDTTPDAKDLFTTQFVPVKVQ